MKIERVLIVDVETTGLDRERDLAIEVAGILLDVEHADVVASASCMARATENAAEAINGIPRTLLRSIPTGLGTMETTGGTRTSTDLPIHFQPIANLAAHADAFVAHRASFDRSFFPGQLAEALPWICTKFGCDWPRGKYGAHLTDLCLAHGVGVPSHHRAIDDCFLIARLMTRVEREFHFGVHLLDILRTGLERGVGEPMRCHHGLEGHFKNQCTSYVRSYGHELHPDAARCPDHGGRSAWFSDE